MYEKSYLPPSAGTGCSYAFWMSARARPPHPWRQYVQRLDALHVHFARPRSTADTPAGQGIVDGDGATVNPSDDPGCKEKQEWSNLLMTPLQLLVFQKQHKIFSHFDTGFGYFCENSTNILCLFVSFLPLSPSENSKTTFLQ
jgi:hypothetical protein